MEGETSTAIGDWQYGKSLPAALYLSTDVFAADMKWLSKSHWFLTGHVSQLKESGDFYLFEIAAESVIVTRDETGEIRAYHNTCRHRGSRLCLEQSGRKRLFTCPYHSWSYDLSGRLVAARSMPSSFDRGENGLLPVQTAVFEGLVFIHFESDCSDFEHFTERFVPVLNGLGVSAARVAARKSYPTRANWKLVVENFFECYHCKTAHPTYYQVHDEMKLLAFGADSSMQESKALSLYRRELELWRDRARSMGYHVDGFFDGADSLHLQASSRLPIGKGALTESVDGQPLAPLMSGFQDFDGGQAGCVFTPLTTLLVCNDHAIIFSFVPMETLVTKVEAIWLVAADAVEGRDYNIESLMQVWDTTLAEDKTITENNQLGVSSIAYKPGTLSDHEVRIADFGEWYINSLSGHVDPTKLYPGKL